MRFLKFVIFAAAVGATPAARAQDVWHATHMMMPGDVIRPDDIAAHALPRPLPDALLADRDLVGQQIRRRVMAGRPLTQPDVGARTAVLAGTPVTVLWNSGALRMEMEGRSIESGAVGDEIRVLNTSSGRTIRGVVAGDGMIEVRSTP